MNYEAYTLDILQKLDVHKSYKGCEYIVSSICYIQENGKYFTPVSKTLYANVAKKHQTSSTCIEKDIRNVIKRIWSITENKDLIRTIFGEYNVDQKPGNMEFIALLYNYVKYEMDYRNKYNSKNI